MKLYEDQISVLIERAFYTWNKFKKRKEDARVVISPDHFIDFEEMVEVKLCQDSLQKRPVKRGEQGERNVRPSNERAMSCSGLLVGKARHLTKDFGNYGEEGGRWLGG